MWNERSKTKQDIFNKETDNKAAIFLSDEFLPCLNRNFSNMLDEPFNLYIDDVEPQTINFAYPQIFEDSSILKIIRLEIGALAAWTPTQNLMITSYAAKIPTSF